VLTVSDSGCGIPPENLPRRYDPLFSSIKEGTDLGLESTLKIVGNYRGKIHADSSKTKDIAEPSILGSKKGVN
jgi:nitrogen-specific signal transduction histidine kinase